MTIDFNFGRVSIWASLLCAGGSGIVCRSCGAIADVDCALGSAPCLEPVTSYGFEIDEAEVTYWGLCPDCQLRRTADA